MTSTLALFGLGTEELLIIAVVVILLFGATAIPKLARSLGQAKGTFSQAKREFEAEAARTEKAGGPGTALASSEADVRRTARGLGIDDQGKSVEELKVLITQKLA